MKKTLTTLVACVLTLAAFAQQPTPELLKDKSLFAKTELFEPTSIFADRAANAALLREYEASPKSFKAEQLLPIAVCYLSFGDLPKAKEAFEAFSASRPDNVRALRTLGTVSLLSKDIEKAIIYYKKAIALGDEQSAVFLGSAFIMSNKPELIAPYLPTLKKLAKTHLEALNVVLIYAGRNKASLDEALVKEVLAQVEPHKVLSTATADGFSTILRIYVATRNVWPVDALVIPARAAALAEVWPLSLSIYNQILEAQPKNALALRGMGLVAYRTGDIMGAADYIQKAYDAGEKDAATDGIELFMLSRNRDIWEKFKQYSSTVKLIPQVRAGLVQYAVGRDDSADIFYLGALGENSDALYKDEAVAKLIDEGVKKYSRDLRASEVTKKLKEIKK